MRKLLFTLFTIGTIFAFTACGSDDPVIEPDYTLYDKSEIIGTQNGKVDISLSFGQYLPINDQTAKTQFIASTSNNSELNLYVTDPGEIGGPIVTGNFKKSPDNTYYTFDFATLGNIEKIENEIPAYIKEWYKESDPTKIIIKELTSKDAKYDKETKMITFTLTGKLEVYTKNDEGVEAKVADNTIIYKFKDLKK